MVFYALTKASYENRSYQSLGFGPSCILTVVDIRMPAIQLLRHSLQHFCGLGLPCQGKVQGFGFRLGLRIIEFRI